MAHVSKHFGGAQDRDLPLAGWWMILVCVVTMMLGPAAPAETRRTITIHGSDTMVNLNRELVAEYTRHHDTTSFRIVGGGSEGGITALMAGKIDIAAASRAIKESELEAFEKQHGERPAQYVIALDGLGVYVHNSNLVSRLTLDQLTKILTGEYRNWAQVGGANRRIDIYNRNKLSGTRTYMQEHVLKGKPFSSRVHDVSTSALLTACVARNQSAIGYSGIAYAQGARIIRLANHPDEPGVWPTRENVTSGKYPLSRPLFYYVNPASINDDLMAFIQWVRSEQGQKVVDFVGYYPAPNHSSTEAENQGESRETLEPIVRRKPIELTPENMRRHAIVLVADIHDVPGSSQVTVALRFDPAGEAIRRIDTVRIRLSEDAELPLAIGDDNAVHFTMRKALLETTVIYLVVIGESDQRIEYLAPLRAFIHNDG